jgi:hypothetical protein
MTLTELEHAEKCMQQQWHDLVMAEQQGNALEVLEQMYDTYILLAEEYNRCLEAYQQEHQSGCKSAPQRTKNTRLNASSVTGDAQVKLAS